MHSFRAVRKTSSVKAFIIPSRAKILEIESLTCNPRVLRLWLTLQCSQVEPGFSLNRN